MSSRYSKDKNEIDLRGLFRRLLQCLWQIMLVTVLGASIMYFVGNAVTETTYSATTSVVVLNQQKLTVLTYTDILVSTQLKDYYSDVVTSRYVVDQVIEEFELDTTYEKFVDRVKVSQYGDSSRIVGITLEDRDPYMAKLLVDELRDVSIAYMTEFMGVDTVKVNVVDESNFPVKPSNTSVMKWMLAGALGGGILAIVIIIIGYLQEDIIRTSEDIEKYLKVSSLGMIPLIQEQEKSGKKKNRQSVTSREDHRYVEAFKTIRTNVEFCGDDIKVVAITSCIPNEGKSSVSYELAHTFAQTGQKVLLIDADLRKSVLVGRHSSKEKVLYGLTHYLAGKQSFQDVCCKTDLENFHIIYAGVVPPNPCELLGNQLFEKLIEDVRGQYDIVIVDTPPVGSVIDAVVVAQKCDGVVIVISAGQISYRFAQKVKEQVEVAGSRVLGCILNKVDMSQNAGYGYYGKYYGKYYGGDSGENDEE